MFLKQLKWVKLVLFSLVIPLVYANDDLSIGSFKAENEKENVSSQEKELIAQYNAPARINVEKEWDFFVDGTFLYWKPKENGLALLRIFDKNAKITKAGLILDSNFTYEPGFKITFGTYLNPDDWTAYIEYTWLKGKNVTHHTIPSDMETNGWVYWCDSNIEPNRIRSVWHINTSIVDGILGRICYAGKNLTTNLYGGLRAYLIDQKYNINYIESTKTNYVRTKADSWGIGPSIGIQTNWFFPNHFRWIGQAYGGLAYQKFKASYFYSNSLIGLISFSKKHKWKMIIPNFETAIGFGWGTYLSNKQLHLDFRALYEFLYFWNQNIMHNIAYLHLLKQTDLPSLGDLFFQGFTCSFALDF